jgi:hypothetical protein
MVERTRDNQRFDQIGSGDRVYAVGSVLTGSADVSSARAWELTDQMPWPNSPLDDRRLKFEGRLLSCEHCHNFEL